ncbi:MAG: T9SS type A sorting domain-containing protein [Chloroflexota bacterium]|nr:T9SS type A sorting domain-containing protein [Chloroflexota bacterium]
MASANAAPLAFAPTDLPPMPPTFTPSAATLSFGNSPNPVVDVNTTYFEVKGAAAYLVEALKVQIYDLSGRLVYEAEEAGASLAWHTDNDYGEYLANGVYLYKLYALFDGQWVVSTVKNVVILR